MERDQLTERRPDPDDTIRIFRESLANEERRKKLALDGNLADLEKLYAPTVVEWPQMNSALKWNFFSERSFEIPDPTTHLRTQKTVDILTGDARVLDYGCGYGYVIAEALRRGLSLDYVGIDFSEGFLNKLRKEYPFFRFYQDLLAVGQDRFDYLLLLEVLEHVLPSQTLGFLRRAISFLRPHGKIVISVPVYEDLAAITVPCWACGSLGNPNGHVRSYTPELLRAELRLSGFELERVVPIHTPVSRPREWYWRLKELFGRVARVPANIIVVAKPIASP